MSRNFLQNNNWINQRSRWIVESVEGFHLNVSSYSPLIGSTYIKLPDELKSSRKGLIKIQNDDNKCFLWCHIRHLNLVDKNPQRITKKDKELVSKLNYERIILYQRKIIARLKCFVMKIK